MMLSAKERSCCLPIQEEEEEEEVDRWAGG